MKIIYKKGNLINATESIIAHGCNNCGVMGSGVARQIRNIFPDSYHHYKLYYKTSLLNLGTVIYCHEGSKIILHCITQNGFGKDGKKYVSYDAIKKCMRQINFDHNFNGRPVKALALPKIGAGLGGGDWNIISKIIEEELITIQPVVYELE